MAATTTAKSTRSIVPMLERLSAIAAPSGNEDRVIAAVVAHAEACGFSPVVDNIGNVVVPVAEGAAGSPLVFAHLDELGLTVRSIDGDGFVGVERLGGVPERVLPGLKMLIHTRAADIPAIVGLKAHHLTPAGEKYVVRPAEELYLDAGFPSRAAAHEAGIRVGDPITYSPSFTHLAGGLVSGKSFDDRLAVAALLMLLDSFAESPPDRGVLVAFTVQEEFNVRGSLAIAQRWRPGIAVQVDVAPACDTPDLAGRDPVRLGGGPVLTRLSFHGRGTLGGLVPHPALLRALEEAAAAAEVPVQYQSIVGLITDAAFLPMATGDGIAAAEVGIPCRYTHSPIETADPRDAELMVRLLERFIRAHANIDMRRGRPLAKQGGMS
ncbi:MAG TPA: M20/M25/M40 family metallo-hydrolase [Candidatus Dormibacteraeota bacterium]|nr:M20/M25/M40 family metallo-hydrolase [Candidatus Dormibacteraeota bacterium]